VAPTVAGPALGLAPTVAGPSLAWRRSRPARASRDADRGRPRAWPGADRGRPEPS